MSTTMLTAESLISGYEAYASHSDLIFTELDAAPAVSPTPSIVSFLSASSPECIMFSIGASAGSVTTTLASGC